MDIRDSIEEKYTNYLNCETDDIDLTVEEAKFILVNDKKVHFVDDLLERAWGVVLSELEKKEAIINEMAKHIHLSGDYECLNKECEDDGDISCEDCIKEYFYKKVKETKDNGSTRNI